jgi:hypothetical protein
MNFDHSKAKLVCINLSDDLLEVVVYLYLWLEPRSFGT